MTLEAATAALLAKALLAPALGHKVKFDLHDDGIIFWDGTVSPPVIDNEAREAETTIGISLADLDKLVAGDLNPTMAYMTGKLKIDGSMGIALKISQLLED